MAFSPTGELAVRSKARVYSKEKGMRGEYSKIRRSSLSPEGGIVHGIKVRKVLEEGVWINAS